MDLWTPVVTSVLVALLMAIQAWINKGRFDTLQRRIDAFEERAERRFDQIAAEIAHIRAEMAQIRSDLLQVVLALTPRQQAG